MSRIFSSVAGNRPGRSHFNLSHYKLLTCYAGDLIPVYVQDCVPGDIFSIGNEVVVRCQPLIAPIFHDVDVYTHTFFVPYRILMEQFPEFMTGGKDGTFTTPLPRWYVPAVDVTGPGTLWDYMGFPINQVPDPLPLDFPRLAYNRIYNEWYNDANLSDGVDESDNNAILKRSWEKDYFTSALPFQQRGVAPALPLTGSASAIWPATSFADQSASAAVLGVSGDPPFDTHNVGRMAGTGEAWNTQAFQAFMNDNEIDVSELGTFTWKDIRDTAAVQRFLELSARSGPRYTEFLQAHYGVSPRDERLQRPEYIGGSKSPIIINEVLQTSQTSSDSPQGTMAGHGIGVDRRRVARYRVEEFGLIMSLMSIRPKAVYQQGINRQWLKESRYDFYNPAFAFLSEQGIYNQELYSKTGNLDWNKGIFGFTGVWNEMRQNQNLVVGEFRNDNPQSLDYWHWARYFASDPYLNSDFIKCDPDHAQIFAVGDRPGFMVKYSNIIHALRPLPVMPTPGLVDHVY